MYSLIPTESTMHVPVHLHESAWSAPAFAHTCTPSVAMKLDKCHGRSLIDPRTLHPLTPRTFTRRRAFYAAKLSSMSAAMERGLQARSAGIEALLAEVDRDIAVSRAVMQGCDAASIDWDAIKKRLRSRVADECPICLSDMLRGNFLTITSCGHVFHKRCLGGFENFAGASGGRAKTCPCCRSGYSSITVPKSELMNM